ncbi:hypothetical protein GZH47_13010 [Paenibacillus rhizovicinus]|uniref:Uncharacterized protein n=1 Tax=Paenibacillus rhizovicinus TaxID=2704463 RepID=A0A6C0NZX7_9BACL|nr:hypothetical protein [Paenibacillus rhizovicinus]QHW31671.1 hypothetical protein GZH47_13010 [Paenibacillus rhizovicinus]
MKKTSILVVLVLLVGAASYLVYRHAGQNKVLPRDVNVTVTLKPSLNTRFTDLPYMLAVAVQNDKSSSNMIYPYIPGMESLSFDDTEKREFAVPGSIGSGSADVKLVREALAAAGIDVPAEQDFVGFPSPSEAGQYKMRAYFRAPAGIRPTDKLYVIYVHHEKGDFGKDLSWTKLIKVKVEL